MASSPPETRRTRQLAAGLWEKLYQGSFGRIQVGVPPAASTVQARFAASTFRSRNPARDAAVVEALDAYVARRTAEGGAPPVT